MITRLFDLPAAKDAFAAFPPVRTVALEALTATYGLQSDLFSLYAKSADGRTSGLLGLDGDAGTLVPTEDDDGSEWLSFASFTGLATLTTDRTGVDALMRSTSAALSFSRAKLLSLDDGSRLAPQDDRVCVTPDLRAVCRLASRYLPLGDEDTFVSSLQARINHGAGRAVSFVTDGATVGTACVFFESERVGFLGGISTDERCRGQGVASALVSALCRELLSRGKQPVLSCVNPAAERVYRSLGFDQIDEKITITL